MEYSSGIIMGVLTIIMLVFGTTFSKLYVCIHIVLLGIILVLTRGTDDVTKQFRTVALTTLSLGIVFTWLALWGSYHALPPINEMKHGDILATAGFPFHTFNYPYPPLGGDEPPLDTWQWFYANEVFWLATAAGVVTIVKQKLFAKTSLMTGLFVVTPIVSVIGLIYLLLRFD